VLNSRAPGCPVAERTRRPLQLVVHCGWQAASRITRLTEGIERYEVGVGRKASEESLRLAGA